MKKTEVKYFQKIAVARSFLLQQVTFICVVFVFFLVSCDEQKRIIEPFVPEGDRIVLLEEITGKGCTNCPKGSREIDNLLTLLPENLVVVSIHAGFFANPQIFPLGQYDLRTTEGEFLYNYLGPNAGYPAGVVNRTPVNNEMQLSANAWASAISSEIQNPPAVEFSISHTYIPDTHELTVTINGIGKETRSGEVHVSIMLTESGIVDAQDDFEAGGIVEDYVHNHVLRDMLTPASGAPVTGGLITGQTFNESYSGVLNASWVEENMEIIVFVSLVEGNNFPVLQAGKVKLIP